MKTYNYEYSIYNLGKLDALIKGIASKLNTASNNIANDVAKFGQSEIMKNYNKSTFKTNEAMNIYKEGSQNIYDIGMRGKQAIYEEYGTGTEGEANSHPLKDISGLNPYNSGKTIRKASEAVSQLTAIPQGELYWTYKDENGKIQYTTGVPAGKEVYNALKSIKNEIPKIVEKDLGDLIGD